MYHFLQLIVVQKKLRQEGELIDSLAKLSTLKEEGGGEKTARSGSSAGGLKNTLKKMKPAGKKKRQRNITAPEISVEALKGLRKTEPQKPTKDVGGRGLFGKKPTNKEKEGAPHKKSGQDISLPQRQMAISAIKEEGHEPLRVMDEEKNDAHFSEYALASRHLSATLPTLSHSKTEPAISYPPDLSQASFSSSIHEEALSTQSSLEAVPLEQLAPPSQGHPEADSGGGSQEGMKLSPGGSDIIVRGGEGEELEGEGAEKDFRKGCPDLYDDYGDEQHKLNLKHVLKFLETCNETSPADLTGLEDWDGWTLATKEVM